jgi:hypothetical protein
MLEELSTWWQNVTPEIRSAFMDGSLILVGLLGGHFLGTMAARVLRSKNFDAALRLPGSSPNAEAEHGITPTMVGGLLVRLTVWAAVAWWMAQKHGRDDLAATLGLAINRTWAVATVLVAALGLGSLLARRLMACVQGFPRGGAEGLVSRNGTGAPRWDAVAAAGTIAYVLVVLVVLLIVADVFDWPLTRTSALALWQLAQNLLIACAALLIGSLGARWARELATGEGAASPEKRAGQYTAMGIMTATTVLAVTMLLTSAGLIIGLAALAVLGFLLWLLRGYLPDIAAGLQLRVHRVQEVWFDGVPWQVAELGFLTSQLCRGGEFCRLQNRVVLEARMHGAPAEAMQQ